MPQCNEAEISAAGVSRYIALTRPAVPWHSLRTQLPLTEFIGFCFWHAGFGNTSVPHGEVLKDLPIYYRV